MKKLIALLLISLPFLLQFCSTSRNAAKSNITYAAHVQPIMEAHCTPCHFPPKGNKKPYNTYLAVKNDIDSIIDRVNRNPGEKGFMPFKHPKLPDSTINLLAQWKKDGLLEK